METTETKGNDNESKKIYQIKKQETSEQERLKKPLVEDIIHSYREKEKRFIFNLFEF